MTLLHSSSLPPVGSGSVFIASVVSGHGTVGLPLWCFPALLLTVRVKIRHCFVYGCGRSLRFTDFGTSCPPSTRVAPTLGDSVIAESLASSMGGPTCQGSSHASIGSVSAVFCCQCSCPQRSCRCHARDATHGQGLSQEWRAPGAAHAPFLSTVLWPAGPACSSLSR